MPRRWLLSPPRPELIRRFAADLKVHPLVGQLLANRGLVDSEDGRKYLDRRLGNLHDPETHPGVVDAADRLYAAVQNRKQICVYGDYDVDGMCASAILLECLRLGGAQPRYYVPSRLDEGYGVNREALQRLRQEMGVEVVVTVDCGIASVDEAAEAAALGLEYIVTDHHEFARELPPAACIVHPRLPGSQYPFGDLCGAGVAFKLAWELARRFSGGRKATPAFQKLLLDMTTLAAVGTICDMVPLCDENRVLVHHGLIGLTKEPPLGLAQLIAVAALDKKSKLTAGDVGFSIGPRLNACGRLGQGRLGVELLTTRD
ncbi:MAG: single-stranded-DNA-specific exonuclease RecJ, partial [Planctomycetia bacterium]